MKSNNEYFVRKQGNVTRNYERLCKLQDSGMPVVKIINYENDILDLEYVSGMDMETFLKNGDYKLLSNFIINLIEQLKKTELEIKDYTSVYLSKLSWIDDLDFSFKSKDLISKLPVKIRGKDFKGD
ncbi:MAG: hypothetical protein ACO3UU_10935, partial [Minisyncoccia bacterium]